MADCFVGLTGQRFALREGGRTVGAGVVSKVIGWAGGRLRIQFFLSSHLWNVVNREWGCTSGDACTVISADLLIAFTLLLIFGHLQGK